MRVAARRDEVTTALAGAQAIAVQARGAVHGVLARWNDPRERALRRRAAVRHVSIGFGASTGTLGVSTAVMAAGGVPDILVAAGGGLTALVAVPTVVALVRLRALRRTPLPAPRPGPVAPPPRGSAAWEPVTRLNSAERGLRELLGVLERDPAVPSSEVHEARAAAQQAAAALRTGAADLAALERARDSSTAAAAELGPLVRSGVARLDAGVAQYDGLVASAARAVAARSGPARHGESLTAAVDRVDALTAALTELAGTYPVPR